MLGYNVGLSHIIPTNGFVDRGIKGTQDPRIHGSEDHSNDAQSRMVVQREAAHRARIDPSTHGGMSMDRRINIDPGINTDHN